MADELKPSDWRWEHVHNKDQLELFYLRILPALRVIARECGYALGVHGSMRRDLDLIAVPWVEKHVDKDELARCLHKAACGLMNSRYEWQQKPLGRWATSFPVCWTEWNETSAGHIDLSVMPNASCDHCGVLGSLTDLYLA